MYCIVFVVRTLNA